MISRFILFVSAILFIAICLIAIVLLELFNLEFVDANLAHALSFKISYLISISIVLTLTGTISKRNTRSKNQGIIGLTLLIAFMFYAVYMMILMNSSGGWKTETIIFENIQDRKIVIAKQIYDGGSLGYDQDIYRIVRIKPLGSYLNQITRIDTSKIDSYKWRLIDMNMMNQ